MDGLQYFDRKQDFTIAWKRLPHWSQAGTVCFVTWRTADSLPAAARRRIAEQRKETLRAWGLNPNGDWRHELSKLGTSDAAKARWEVFAAWDRQLDLGLGECVLRRPELSEIVETSVRYFDDDRYVVTDVVDMPNHIHVLVAFRDDDQLVAQVSAWKRFSGRQINAALNRSGEFWQVEQFDHLVRSPEQFDHFRRYLAMNPEKAGLRSGEFRHYSREL